MVDTDVLLGEREHVVPELGFFTGLQLGDVEVRAAAVLDQRLGVVEEVEAEVDERPGCRHAAARAIDEGQVLLDQVPAARAHHDRRSLLGGDLVGLARLVREAQFTADGVAQRQLPADHVLPGGAGGVFLVGEPDLRAGVQRVDGHLRVGGPGDLHTAVLKPRPGAGDAPVGVFADVPGVVAELRVVAAADLEPTAHAVGEAVMPPVREPVMQLGEEGDRVRGEDLVEPVALRTGDGESRALLDRLRGSGGRGSGGNGHDRNPLASRRMLALRLGCFG